MSHVRLKCKYYEYLKSFLGFFHPPAKIVWFSKCFLKKIPKVTSFICAEIKSISKVISFMCAAECKFISGPHWVLLPNTNPSQGRERERGGSLQKESINNGSTQLHRWRCHCTITFKHCATNYSMKSGKLLHFNTRVYNFNNWLHLFPLVETVNLRRFWRKNSYFCFEKYHCCHIDANPCKIQPLSR